MIDKRSTKAYKLEKENRELKKDIERLNKELQLHKEMEKIAMDCQNELTEKIEKAIEYIKSFGSDSDRKNYLLYFNEIINIVLNILQGADKE